MNTRLGIRVSERLRADLDEIVRSGQFKNISELIRELAERHLMRSKRKRVQTPRIKEKQGDAPR